MIYLLKKKLYTFKSFIHILLFHHVCVFYNLDIICLLYKLNSLFLEKIRKFDTYYFTISFFKIWISFIKSEIFFQNLTQKFLSITINFSFHFIIKNWNISTKFGIKSFCKEKFLLVLFILCSEKQNDFEFLAIM